MFNKFGSQSAAWSAHNKQGYDMDGMCTFTHWDCRSPCSDFRQDSQTLMYKCRICPVKVGANEWMSKKRMNDHATNKGHLKAKEEKERVKRHRTSSNRINHSQSNDVLTDTAELHGETSGSNCSHDPLTPNATILAANPIVGKASV